MRSHISMQQFLSRKAKVKGHSTAFTTLKSQVHTNNLGRSPEIAANSTCKSRGLTVFMEKSLPELVDPMSLQFILLKTEITSDILRPRNHNKMQNNIEAVYLVCHLCITCFCFRARRTLIDFRPRPQSLFSTRSGKPRWREICDVLSGTRQICSATMKMFLKCIFDEPFKLKSFLAK